MYLCTDYSSYYDHNDPATNPAVLSADAVPHSHLWIWERLFHGHERRPEYDSECQPAAIQVQRQGAGHDARTEHLRLRSKAVLSDTAHVGQT